MVPPGTIISLEKSITIFRFRVSPAILFSLIHENKIHHATPKFQRIMIMVPIINCPIFRQTLKPYPKTLIIIITCYWNWQYSNHFHMLLTVHIPVDSPMFLPWITSGSQWIPQNGSKWSIWTLKFWNPKTFQWLTPLFSHVNPSCWMQTCEKICKHMKNCLKSVIKHDFQLI